MYTLKAVSTVECPERLLAGCSELYLFSVIMGVDPGFRNGCKYAVISAESGEGTVLDTGVVYPNFNKKGGIAGQQGCYSVRL